VLSFFIRFRFLLVFKMISFSLHKAIENPLQEILLENTRVGIITFVFRQKYNVNFIFFCENQFNFLQQVGLMHDITLTLYHLIPKILSILEYLIALAIQ